MSKQRLLDTMKGPVEPGRHPVSLIGGGAWTLRQGGTNFREMAIEVEKNLSSLSDIIVRLNRGLGEGIVFIGAGYNNAIAAQIRGVEMVYTADFSPYLPDFTKDQTEKFIRECEKFDVRKIWDHSLLASFPAIAEKVSAQLKESHVITPLTWGPFTLAGQMMGVETLMRKMVKDPGAAEAVLNLAVEAVWEFYRPFVEKGLADIIYLPEPTASGDMISPRIMEKFAAPIMDKCLKPYRQKGLPSLVHICGNLTNDQLTVIDGMEYLDAISIDSKVDMIEARKRIIHKCIGGNIDTMRLERAGKEEITGDLKGILYDMAGHRRFIVMPACDLAPGTPYDNVKTFFDFVRDAKALIS